MKRNILFFQVILLFIVFITGLGRSTLFAEGSREIMPTALSYGRLEIYQMFSNFAQFGCASEDRLNIHIKTAGEKICFGFGNNYDNNQFLMNDVSCRIIDPSGNIALTTTLLPSSGNGFISTWSQAVSGPDIINPAGYPCLSLTATMAGDYYIEFTYADLSVRREFEFFDITVLDAANNPINGRVWSKAWQFTTTASTAPNYYDYPFYGKLYVYADDGVVTSLDFNGMRPYVFVFSANQSGCFNTGNLIQDRKSVHGRHTYPQYKIFLNDPDSTCYPSGILGDFLEATTVSGCPPDDYCINVNVNKGGTVEIVIDLNGIPGYQEYSVDILQITQVDSGNNCIPWNGKDNFGNMVAFGANISIEINYYNGITHIPIYDVEYNENGFIVDIVRPLTPDPHPPLFWDDSDIPGFVAAPLNGCIDLTGCHDFTNFFGDTNTINTWWYAASNIKDSFMFQFNFLSIDYLETDENCFNSQGSIELLISGGTPPFTYNWSTGQTSALISGLNSGNYTATITDHEGCSLNTEINVENIPCPITIPNIFTPNGDGSNDYLVITNVEQYQNKLLIYNRWGKLIREFEDYSSQWDGKTTQGIPVADGVYYYILLLTNTKQEFHGTITIIR
jgi:gliding motility-associated-like protein